MQRAKACRDCAVRDKALCKALSPEDLAKLNRLSYRKRYSAGQLIAGLLTPEAWCATILAGVVKLTKSLADGRQQIVGLLFPSDFLGRPFKTTSAYAAEAATDVQLCCYSRRHFEHLLTEQPDLKQLLLERTLDVVDASHEWMLLLGCKSAKEKVAALLVLIAHRLAPADAAGARQPPLRIERPLSRAEIADYLGLRLETVSRQLNRLEAAGVIKRFARRGIEICDARELERLAGDPS
jgi:CRP/FNR family transcriptional regulator, anaerobic regulatory protein